MPAFQKAMLFRKHFHLVFKRFVDANSKSVSLNRAANVRNLKSSRQYNIHIMAPLGCEATYCSTLRQTSEDRILGQTLTAGRLTYQTAPICHRHRTGFDSARRHRPQTAITRYNSSKFPQYLRIVRDHHSHHHRARLDVDGRRTGINSHTLHPVFSCYLFPSSEGRREKSERVRGLPYPRAKIHFLKHQSQQAVSFV